MEQRTVGAVLVFAAAAGFGTLAIFGKLAAAVGLPTSTLLLLRFVVASALVWAAFGARGGVRPLSGRRLRVATAIGLVYGGMTVLFFWGLEYLTAGLAAIVFYTYPVHVLVLSTVLLDERLTPRRVLALALAVVGVGVIVGASPAGANPAGVGLVLLAAFGYATYTTASRAALAAVDPGRFTATALVGTTLSMLPYAAVTGGLALPTTASAWGVVVGIGLLGTALPIYLFVEGLERIEASHASIIGTAEPLVTVLLGAMLLGEAVTPVVAAGGALVLAGVLVVQRDSRPSGMVAH